MKIILLVLLYYNTVSGLFFDIDDITSSTLTKLPQDFPLAIKDIAEGLPARTMTVVRGESTNIR